MCYFHIFFRATRKYSYTSSCSVCITKKCMSRRQPIPAKKCPMLFPAPIPTSTTEASTFNKANWGGNTPMTQASKLCQTQAPLSSLPIWPKRFPDQSIGSAERMTMQPRLPYGMNMDCLFCMAQRSPALSYQGLVRWNLGTHNVLKKPTSRNGQMTNPIW